MMSVNYGNKYDRFYVALGLPIKEDCYEIDYDAFRKLVRYFLTDDFVGIGGGLIVNPEAGEIFTMTRDEKKKIMAIAAEETNGKIPIFCGVSNSRPTDAALEAKDAIDEGADGIFVMPPIGCLDVTLGWNVRKYPEVFINTCNNIRDAVDVPFIAHGAGPKDPVYGLSYPIETVDQILDAVPNIVGWKMMYNFKALKDVAFHLREREAQTGRHVGLLQSSAHLFLEAGLYDILDGSVSCFWNYSKEPNVALIKAIKENRMDDAKKIFLDDGLFQLHNTVGRDHSRLHTLFKVAAWLKGLYPTPYLRAPMILPMKSEIVELKAALERAGQPVISDAEIEKVYNKLPR